MTDDPPPNDLTDTRASVRHEIPLRTPSLEGFLPEPSESPARKKPMKRWVKWLWMLLTLGAGAVGLVLVLPTGEIPDPPGGALVQFVPSGAQWKYLDDGTDPGPHWASLDYDDGNWAEGHALFGYGRENETTVLRCRVGWPEKAPCPKGGESDRILTYYFRHVFEVDDPKRFDRARLSLLKDDGAVVFLNGEAIVRANMAPGVMGWNEPAAHEAENGRAWFDYFLDLRKLNSGRNVLAVELHQAAPGGQDVAFDLQAVAFDSFARAVRRGPYLQMVGPDSAVIRWQTIDRIQSVVRWGTDESLGQISQSPGIDTDHRVRLEGLAPGSTYFYSLGAEDHRLSKGQVFSFTTSPAPGSESDLRIWVVGDQGTGDALARKVKLAAMGYAGARPPDLWLTLGDNAYDDGRDDEFQRALFETYPEQLARLSLWPASGNHDLKSVKDGKGPYYDIFELPTEGEVGGVPSKTEAYYSFDYGPMHFISLDTTKGDLRPGRDMLTWLQADLDANALPWTIVFFHHPPYSDGWHRSDDPKKGWRMTAVRENVLPILEESGVDLVLAGHSHSYERSFLLHGHYGTSDTLSEAMKLDGGDGSVQGDGAYRKLPGGRGTVYVVAGSSGKLATGELEHPAMVVSLERLGSLIIDIQGKELDLTFVTDDGEVGDSFRLIRR